jgi:hypothetical protein
MTEHWNVQEPRSRMTKWKIAEVTKRWEDRALEKQSNGAVERRGG